MADKDTVLLGKEYIGDTLPLATEYIIERVPYDKLGIVKP